MAMISLCLCGTCAEAFDGARRQAEKLAENQCAVWIWQVGYFMTQLASAALMKNDKAPLTRNHLDYMQVALAEFAHEPEQQSRFKEFVATYVAAQEARSDGG